MNANKKSMVHGPDDYLKKRLLQFDEKLKKHLSNEMIYLTEKKDDYENQILQLKIEREQRDKTLFQHVEQRDILKYFSPLNLSDMEDNKKDDRQKELSDQIQQIKNNISQIDKHMEDIRELIREMDDIINSGKG